MTTYHYRADQELPAFPLAWSDRTNTLIDFSAGWTATVKVAIVTAPETVVLTKTTGITLDSASPNYVVDFSATDMSTITAAAGTISTGGVECVVYPYCKRDSDSQDRVFQPGNEPRFTLFAAPAAPA